MPPQMVKTVLRVTCDRRISGLGSGMAGLPPLGGGNAGPAQGRDRLGATRAIRGGAAAEAGVRGAPVERGDHVLLWLGHQHARALAVEPEIGRRRQIGDADGKVAAWLARVD